MSIVIFLYYILIVRLECQFKINHGFIIHLSYIDVEKYRIPLVYDTSNHTKLHRGYANKIFSTHKLGLIMRY